jgi:hypothetical protein
VNTPHGQIRVRVATSAIRLLRFTVPDICRETGFSRDQVYPVLQKLEDEHFLVVRPLSGGSEPKANRPLNVYSVTEDRDTKRQLLDEIKKFLPSDYVWDDSESLARARAGLDLLPAPLLALEQTADELPAIHENRRTIGELKEQIEAVSGDLEIALYDLGVVEGTEPPPPLQAAIEKLHAYRQDLTSIEARVIAIEERLEAQKKASRVLRRVARRYYESVEPAYALFEGMADTAFATKALEQPSWILGVRQREHQRALTSHSTREKLDFYRRVLDQRYQHANTFQLKAILSDFNRELATAVELGSEKPSEPTSATVWQALYELAIRYGDNPQTALGVLNLSEQRMPRDFYTAYYDAINFQFIAGSRESAFSSWRDWTEKRLREEVTSSQSWAPGRLERAFYRSMLFAAVPAASLNEQLLARVKEALGIAFSFSIVSAERLESLGPPSHVIEPTLTSPFRSSEMVRLSESMRIGTPEYHVYGPIEDVLRGPGVPKIAFATALFRLGLPSTDAWALATGLEVRKALIVINSQEPAQTGILPRFAKVSGILSSAISALRGIAETGRIPLPSGESFPEVDRPALYERDSQDALHRVDELGFNYGRHWLTKASHE